MAIGEKKSFFVRLTEGLSKTTENIMEKIGDVVLGRPAIDEDMLEELEEALILSDIGMDTTERIIEKLRSDIKQDRLQYSDDVINRIKEIVTEILTEDKAPGTLSDKTPLVILMIGVNGSGKTTSMGKIAHMLKGQGKSVMFAAADTFRAAAIEQLEIWGKRTDVPVIRHSEGADPSAVIFDAIKAAQARNVDVLICDTAGRLQNKKNLMNELAKMYKIIGREYPEADLETLLVLDAATGKNAVQQAKEFGEVAQLTGIVLTKLDGTAKGGIVITLADQFGVPVKFIGVGEGMDDLQVFDPETFAEALFTGVGEDKMSQDETETVYDLAGEADHADGVTREAESLGEDTDSESAEVTSEEATGTVEETAESAEAAEVVVGTAESEEEAEAEMTTAEPEETAAGEDNETAVEAEDETAEEGIETAGEQREAETDEHPEESEEKQEEAPADRKGIRGFFKRLMG